MARIIEDVAGVRLYELFNIDLEMSSFSLNPRMKWFQTLFSNIVLINPDKTSECESI